MYVLLFFFDNCSRCVSSDWLVLCTIVFSVWGREECHKYLYENNMETWIDTYDD